MRRREFMSLLPAVAAWPLAAHAEQSERTRRIAVLMGLAENDPEGQARAAAFLRTLRELGWVDGRNIRVDWRWAAGDAARTEALATELVSSTPEVIVVNTPRGLSALRQATVTIPIVFAQVTDVSESGIINPAHPQDNVTGFTHFYTYEVSGKWLQLLKEIAPAVMRVALLQSPTHPSWSGYVSSMKEAASAAGVQLYPVPVNAVGDIDRVFDDLPAASNIGLVVPPDTFTTAHRDRIVSLANERRVPAIYSAPIFAAAGGLISYGADVVELVRLTATYVDRVLRGASPKQLPVQSSSKFKLVINLRTASTLGLAVPPMLLARADEVIE
jgi:putative tryptophan/tyrosine transport system substrate-binding protein